MSEQLTKIVFDSDMDALDKHILGPLFLEKAFEARETTEDGQIPRQTVRELELLFGLESGEAAALAFLAKLRAGEEITGIDLETDYPEED